MKSSDAPSWFERKYPSCEDLEQALEARGCRLTQAEIGDEALFVVGEGGDPHVVILPIVVGPLRRAWLLAHELGHLVQHSGYIGPWTHDRQEHQADAWAARALIPESAVRRHRNASVDAFVAALSRHYEDLPMIDCPERWLAGRIAKTRLNFLEEQCVDF
jgi:hypothetical protein